MGIWASLSSAIGGNYRYRAGPNTLGIGIENLALEQPGRAIDADFYSPRYNIRNSITPYAPAIFGVQKVPTNDLRANGVYLSGDIALQALIEMQNRGAD